MIKIVNIIFFIVIPLSVTAQIPQEMSAYFAEKKYEMPWLFVLGDKDSVINEIEQYRQDKLPPKRSVAYDLMYGISLFTKDTLYKRRLIEKIVLSQLDSSATLRVHVVSKMKSFNKSDYSVLAVSDLMPLTLVENEKLLNTDNIRILGMLNLPAEGISNLASRKFEEYYGRIWAAKLAMARMGNKNYTIECINLMRPAKNDLSAFYTLCKDAAYIRNEKAIAFLVELLNTNERSPAPSPGGKEGYLASVALRTLHGIITNMPYPDFKKGIDDPEKERLDEVRKWMSVNKDKYDINQDVLIEVEFIEFRREVRRPLVR
jgi:hypothetical protein